MAFVEAVARNECTHNPFTSALMPVSSPYFPTIFDTPRRDRARDRVALAEIIEQRRQCREFTPDVGGSESA
jgi:hypothetical protein